MNMTNDILAHFAKWLFELAKATRDDDTESMKVIQKIAFELSSLLEEESEPNSYHDLFIEIMLYADHRLWKQTGDHNLPEVEKSVEESLRRLGL